MLEYLRSLKTIDDYNKETSLIEKNFTDFKNMVEVMSKGNKKNKGTKILNIVDKILIVTLKEWKQRGQGLKILTPNQMLSRLPISLA